MSAEKDRRDEDAARMAAVRDLLLEATAAHEAACPGTGEACWRNRGAAIAYLCHALGLRGPELWAYIRRETEDYDRRCGARHKDTGVCDG